MNWTQFLTGIIAAYSIYYALNVLFDLFIQRRSPVPASRENELVFDSPPPPQQVAAVEVAAENSLAETPEGHALISSGPLQSTGGVGIKQLVALAQGNVIDLTKSIPY